MENTKLIMKKKHNRNSAGIVVLDARLTTKGKAGGAILEMPRAVYMVN